MGSLAGKVAIVTGATSGIGEGSRKFLQRKARRWSSRRVAKRKA